jgi:hypothetical protein
MALLDRLISEFRAWSLRQYEKSIQAPVFPSQGELWRSIHGGR